MTFIFYELDRYYWRYTRCGRMNFVRQVFESYHITACECVHFVTRGHLRSRDKDGGHAIRSAIAKSQILNANFMPLCFIEPELLLVGCLFAIHRQILSTCLSFLLFAISIRRQATTSDPTGSFVISPIKKGLGRNLGGRRIFGT